MAVILSNLNEWCVPGPATLVSRQEGCDQMISGSLDRLFPGLKCCEQTVHLLAIAQLDVSLPDLGTHLFSCLWGKKQRDCRADQAADQQAGDQDSFRIPGFAQVLPDTVFHWAISLIINDEQGERSSRLA